MRTLWRKVLSASEASEKDHLDLPPEGHQKYTKKQQKTLVRGAVEYDVETSRQREDHDEMVDNHLWQCVLAGLSIIDLVNAARNVILDQSNRDANTVKRWVSKNSGGEHPPVRAKVALAAEKLDPEYPFMSRADKKWDGTFPVPEEERADLVEGVIEKWKESGFGDINIPATHTPPCSESDISFDSDAPNPSDFPATPQGYASYMRTLDQHKLDNARARQICNSCPFRVECLAISFTRHKKKHDGTLNLNSVSMDRNGMWGGYTPRERNPVYKEFKKRFTGGVRSGEFDIPNTSAPTRDEVEGDE